MLSGLRAILHAMLLLFENKQIFSLWFEKRKVHWKIITSIDVWLILGVCPESIAKWWVVNDAVFLEMINFDFNVVRHICCVAVGMSRLALRQGWKIGMINWNFDFIRSTTFTLSIVYTCFRIIASIFDGFYTKKHR